MTPYIEIDYQNLNYRMQKEEFISKRLICVPARKDMARVRLVASLLLDDMSLRKLPTLPFHSRDDSKSDNGSSDDVHHSVGWPMTGCFDDEVDDFIQCHCCCSSFQCGKELEDGFLELKNYHHRFL